MKIPDFLKKEPARFFAALGTLWTGLITGVIQFDLWHPTVEQLAYANGFIGLLASFLLATVLRSYITPNVTVDEKVHDTIVELSKDV